MRRRDALLALVLLTGCGRGEGTSEAPRPRELTDRSVSQFCGMSLIEMAGPKGQIFIRGLPDPYWFGSVRDMFAFVFLPEMPKAIAAIYVSDMARVKNWGQPEPGTWVDARKASYVIGSRRRNGMGAGDPVRRRRRSAPLRGSQRGPGRQFRRRAARLCPHSRIGRPLMRITRRRFIAISAAAGGLPLRPIAPARAAPLLRVWTGTALGCDATLQIHHPDAATADRLIRPAWRRFDVWNIS